jgi:RNA polymerase sigma factor (sigma-70 family)
MEHKPLDLVRTFLEQRDGLLAFILALTRDREAAEEVFQEVGLAVVEEAGRGTRVDRFLPWVHEMARRRVAEYFRKRSRRSLIERPDSFDEAVSLAFQEQAADPQALRRRQELLADCLRDLSASNRRMIEKRYGGRSSLKSIADELSMTEASVKVTLWRARRELEQCIEGKIGDE